MAILYLLVTYYRSFFTVSFSYLHSVVGPEPAFLLLLFLLLVFFEGAEHPGHEVCVVDGGDPDGSADVVRLRAELAAPVHRRPRDQLVLYVLPVLVWQDLIDVHSQCQ